MAVLPQEQAETTQRNAEGEGVSIPPPPSRNVSSTVLNFLQLQPGLVVTFGYLLLTAVGITYDVLFYELFHIPILNFSEPGDFLLAGFRQPVLILLFLLSNMLLWRLILKDRKWRQKSTQYKALAEKMEKSKWYSTWVLYPLIVVGYFFITTSLYAKSTASHIKAGEGRRVIVEFNANSADTKRNERAPVSLLLGANSKFLFLYTQVEGKVQAVPIASVSRMTLDPVALGAPVADPGSKPPIQGGNPSLLQPAAKYHRSLPGFRPLSGDSWSQGQKPPSPGSGRLDIPPKSEYTHVIP